MGKYVMVIDRGSTNIKVILFDKTAREQAISSCPCQRPVSVKPGWWEQDMEQMWQDCVSAVKGLWKKGCSPEDIEGIFVTGQGNGMMPVDRNGRPFRSGILSSDSRGGKIMAGWSADGSYDKAVSIVGMPFGPGSPLVLLAWFMKESPAEYKKIYKVLFSKDWIRYKLSGSVCTDQTDASGAGLMDLRNGVYAEEAFRILGVGNISDKLPVIRASHEIVGEVTEEAALETGLLKGTPVLCGAHDIAAYPLGAGASGSREVVSVIGTWGCNECIVKDTTGVLAALYSTVPGEFLALGGDSNSGGCFDLMLDTLFEHEKSEARKRGISVYQYAEELASSSRPSGVMFHPFIFGASLFGNACGGLYGLRNWHTKADIMRAVYEGIVMGHYMNIRYLPEWESFETLCLIGGGARSRLYGQLFADITGISVIVPKSQEITARGGALNALVGLGVFSDHSEARIAPETMMRYEPDPKQQKFYREKFELFCDAYEMNKKIWTPLNEMNL